MTIAVVGLAFTMLAAQAPDSRAVQPAAGTARVRGVVVKADSGAPVPRATLRLTSRTGTWEATSDAAGHFQFTRLPGGAYALTARKAGYVTTRGGSESASDANRSFDVAAGQTVDRVVIRMLRGGAVEGRVLDENGEPIVEAYVRALRAEYISGSRRLSSVQTVQTNDLGEYRLYGLLPGTYYIAGSLGTFDLSTYNPQNKPAVMRGASGLAPTFFPGTVLAADAQAVTVRAGADVLGIDFALGSVRLARLSGVVVDSRGKPAAGDVVMLNVARTGGASVTSDIREMKYAEPSADGTFVLSNVAPGEYRIDVRSKAAMEAIAHTGGVGMPQGPDPPEYASLPITVNGEDIDGIKVTTIQGRRMSGRVLVEGLRDATDAMQRMKVSTSDLSAGMSVSAVLLGAAAPVQADGTFEIVGLSGTRIVRVYGLPAGWALKSVRESGVDVTDEGIQVRADDITGVEVVVTPTPAQISGIVVDDRGRPVEGAAVIVFPVDRGLWKRLLNRHVASARAGEDGSFRFSPLPATDYFVAVVDELIDGEWAEPDHLERLRESAVRIILRDGESKTLTLRR